MSEPLLQTLEQRRAKQAWDDVQAVVNHPDGEFKKRYGSLARRVPTLVLTNGLGQTLAFLLSKSKNNEDNSEQNEHGLLFHQISNWTMSRVAPGAKDSDLLVWILNNNSDAYRLATVEALAYLTWLKRFAEAVLPTEED